MRHNIFSNISVSFIFVLIRSIRILLNDKFGDGWNLARLVLYASTGWHRAYDLECAENSRLENYCFHPELNADGDFIVLGIVGFRASHFWDVSYH